MLNRVQNNIGTQKISVRFEIHFLEQKEKVALRQFVTKMGIVN